MTRILPFLGITILLFFFVSKTKAQGNQIVANGAATTAATFPNTGCVYNWVNNTPGIGLAASGTGDIASFTAVNNTNAPITATITATPATNGFAYVPNSFSGNVSVINVATGAVVATIPVGPEPLGVSVSADRSRVYVSSSNTPTVFVINTATNAVVSTISISVGSNHLVGVVVSPDGTRLYVANTAGTIAVINTSNNAVIATIPVGSNPSYLSVSPDGNWVYVANEMSGSVSVINTTTNTIVATIAIGTGPYAVAVSPDGSKVYVTNGSTITIINTATNTISGVISSIPAASNLSGIVVSPDGSRLYVTNEGSAVFVINTVNNALVATINEGIFAYGISITSDGRLVYVSDRVSNKVSVISTATNTIVGTINVGIGPDALGNFITAGISCVPVTFTITVNPPPPTILTTGAVSAMTTTYGTPSNTQTFNVSGTYMTAGILVTPPPGFEVSTDNSTFGNTVIVGAGGAIASTPVYMRLAASTAVGNYSGNIALSSAGAANVNVATVNSNVTPASLTITPVMVSKIYGASLANITGSTAFTAMGLQNSETIGSISIAYGTGSAATAPTGTYTGSVTGSIATGGSFSPGNYSISYLTNPITVTPASLTITPNNATKSYGAILTGGAGSTSFSTTGLQNSENIGSITVAYGTGAGATVAVGTYAGSVTVSAPVGGTFTAGNYSITYTNANIVVTPAALSITANDVTKTYGTGLTGVAGSTAFTTTGLQNSETIGSITVAYGTGSTATAAVGTYAGSVTGSAPSGGTFTASNYAITYTPGNIIIRPAAVTITASDVTKTYGATVTGGTGSTAFTITSLQNSETIGSITLVYGSGSAATAAAGTYAGQVTGSAATGGTFIGSNYAITYVPGNIIVTPAALTVTANDVTKTYGTALTGSQGSIAFTTIGLQNSETIGSITEAYGTGSATTAAVGTYTGSVTGSAPVGGTFTAGNYSITYAPGNIIVSQAVLTITASDVTKTYGTALTGAPGSTAFTTTGLQNSETIGSITVAYGTGSVPTAAVGTYAGSVTGLAPLGGTFTASNYAITYTPGNIIIKPAAMTITASDETKTYGATVMGRTSSTGFTITGLQNSETIGSITLAYGSGSAATAAAGTYAGQVTGSVATGGTFSGANYLITYLSGNIIVNPAAIIITASDVNKTYGATLTDVAGSTAFTATGLQNSETIGSVSIAYGRGFSAASAVGTYTGAVTGSSAIGGTFTAGNYSITYAPGNIIVNPAALIITNKDVTKTYGTALTGGPGSTAFTTTGLQNSETIGNVTVAYGTGSAPTVAVGTYAGSVTGSAATGGTFTSANYTVTYLSGNIIVSPAVLTITANDVTKTYGTALTGGSGSTAFTTIGLQNAETIGSITIAYGTGSAATAAVGTYTGPVTGSTATGGTFTSTNYTITYLPGNIIVRPAALTITANDVTKLFGNTLTGGPGSTAFTTTGLKNSETIGSVTLAYGTGSAPTAAVGTYLGSVIASAPVGGTFSSGNYDISYVAGNLIVIPVLTVSAATGTISACAGTASASPNVRQFTVSGSGLTDNINATAPTGFEVSLTTGGGYGSAVILVQSGGIVNSIVYVRSAASASTGSISGSVMVTSTGAASQNVVVTGTINPLPVINAVANQTIVNGAATTAVNFTGTANTFSWTNDIPGIGLAASGTGNIASFNAVNTGRSPVGATIKITPVNVTGCTGTPITFTITVNPSPAITVGTATGSISTCAGSASAGPNIQQATVSGSYLMGDITATAPPGGEFEISLAAGSGYSSSLSLAQASGTVAGTLIYIRSAVSATGSISGNVTLVSPGAINQTIAVTGIVNPLPAVNAIAQQAAVNSTLTTDISFTGTANSYNWTNDTPGIGLAASGTGNITSFNAVNIGTSPVIATITVTPVNVTGCTGTPTTFTITVNPSPAIKVGTATGSIFLCAGSASVSPNIQQATVSGTYLLGDITATAPVGFEVSLAAGSGFGSSVTLTQSAGTISNAVIYVRSGASALPGNLSGNITLASNGAITQDAVVSATVYALPAVDFIVPGVCLADAYAQFIDASTITDNTQSAFTYLWNFGDPHATPANNTSTQQNPRHKYSQEGIYTATLTVTSKNGCTVAKSKAFTVNGSVPLAGFTVENKGYLCSGDSVTFDDQSSVDFGNITRIVWFFDYNNHPTDSVVYTASTMRSDKKYRYYYGLFNSPPQQNYTVMMIAYSGQVCKNVIQQTITINANPIVTLSPSGNITLCQADNANQIIENKNGFIGTGVFTGAGVSTTGLFDPRVSGPGVFTVNYLFTANNTECTYSTSLQVTVNPTPVVSVPGAQLTLLEGGEINLNVKATISSGTMIYKWSPTFGLNQDNILNPVANPVNDIIYTLTVTSDKYCIATTSIFVKVLKEPSVPNSFTPNGDGINDTWNIRYLDQYPNATVEIFNRYGEKVYYSHNYPIPWDGTYKGTNLPAGTYYYIINPNSGRKALSGHVTIIR